MFHIHVFAAGLHHSAPNFVINFRKNFLGLFTAPGILLFIIPNFIDAEVHEVNMTALAKAYSYLHSSFWVVDRKHFYIGSAGMDLESLSTVM